MFSIPPLVGFALETALIKFGHLQAAKPVNYTFFTGPLYNPLSLT